MFAVKGGATGLAVHRASSETYIHVSRDNKRQPSVSSAHAEMDELSGEAQIQIRGNAALVVRFYDYA